MKSVITKNLKDKLCEIFMSIAHWDKYIEGLKQSLYQTKNFVAYHCFSRIDRKASGYILNIDLLKFLNDPETPTDALSEFQCNLLIKQFDTT